MGEQYKGSGELTSLFKARVTELLGMEYPIIAGALGHITLSKFTAAVPNAGCFGFLPATSYATTEEETN
jgi:nitronate monooxygenase